jgi:diguanylate cyclase (GGDEF)-like protein
VVQQVPSAAAPRLTSSRVSRLLHPGRWLLENRRAANDRSAFGFGARLLATAALSFVLIGITAYVFLERTLAQRQITDYAAVQRSDARAFEILGSSAADTTGPIPDIDRLLDSVETRPGTRDAVLIDSRGVIRASSHDAQVGTPEDDPRVIAALRHGTSYAGHETDPVHDHRDFQFVIPVNLPKGRYAYEVTYNHSTYDAQLSAVRRVLGLGGLLAVMIGGAVFYLVGGRRLMRDHRMVLRRATRDGPTDLPNQRAFQDEFPRAVASAARYQDSFALVLLDVDDLKLINDRHGHQQGDAILKRVAEILQEARPGDRPYRVGGDEFALSLVHTDAEGARTLAQRLSRDLADSGIEASIGVSALRPGLPADTLRAEADAALYEAKRRGGNRAAQFDDIRGDAVMTTPEKKEAVLRLVEEGRLETVFQPIWKLHTETLLGVEALTRPDPSYGLSGPAEAFDIAEQIGRVHRLDVLCVKNALQAAPELRDGVLMFINVSPLTLDLDADGDNWLLLAVERAGLSPQGVVVEVTERFGGRTPSVVKCLQRLRQQGFKIAVDDVGTGNSGLDMLRKLHAEFVKIDRSIVVAAATESGARAVLMAMAAFARQTGAFVIAEGIEDDDTLEFLRGLDDRDLSSDTIIQGGQGFGLGRPSHDLSPESPAILHDGHSHAHPVLST